MTKIKTKKILPCATGKALYLDKEMLFHLNIYDNDYVDIIFEDNALKIIKNLKNDIITDEELNSMLEEI